MININGLSNDIFGVYLNGKLLEVSGVKLNGEIVLNFDASIYPLTIDMYYGYDLTNNFTTDENGYLNEDEIKNYFNPGSWMAGHSEAFRETFGQLGLLENHSYFLQTLYNWFIAQNGDSQFEDGRNFSSLEISYYYDKENDKIIKPEAIDNYLVTDNKFEAVYNMPFLDIKWLGCEEESFKRVEGITNFGLWSLTYAEDNRDVISKESDFTSSILCDNGPIFPTKSDFWMGDEFTENISLNSFINGDVDKNGILYSFLQISDSSAFPDINLAFSGESNDMQNVVFEGLTGAPVIDFITYYCSDRSTSIYLMNEVDTLDDFFWLKLPINSSYEEAYYDYHMLLVSRSLYYAVAAPHFGDPDNFGGIYFILGAELAEDSNLLGIQVLIKDPRDNSIMFAPILEIFSFEVGCEECKWRYGISTLDKDSFDYISMPHGTGLAYNAFWVNLCSYYSHWKDSEGINISTPMPYYIYCTDGIGGLEATNIAGPYCNYAFPKWTGMFSSYTPIEPIPQYDEYILTELSDLATGDIVVIVTTDNYAMSNDNGTSNPPDAVSLGLNIEGNSITSEITERLMWYVVKNGEQYSFYKIPEKTANYGLYCNDTNNGVRVGKNTNNIWEVAEESTTDYIILKNTATSRYLTLYNKEDFRSYSSIQTEDVYNCNLKIFKGIETSV